MAFLYAKLRRFSALVVDHRKKFAFALAVSLYAAYYNDRRLKRNNVLRRYCLEAEKFGEEILKPNASPRKVTVLLNESSKNGKGRSNFERYALPLLHLAGMQVNLIKPKDEKQMFDIASVIDSKEADTLYVVGGDGSFSKVVNGLMEQSNSITQKQRSRFDNIPTVAAFPGGFENTFAKELLPLNDSEVKWYCENAMAVLAGLVAKRSVVEVTIDEETPFYMAQFAHIGHVAEIERIKHKYWYWGSLKTSFAYCWHCLKTTMQPYNFTFMFTEPCPGCSSCQIAENPNVVENRLSWWQKLLGRRDTAPVATDRQKYVNEHCDNLNEFDLKTSEVSIGLDKNLKFNGMRIVCGPASPSRVETIAEGRKRHEQPGSTGLWPTDSFSTKSFFAKFVQIRCDESLKEQKTIFIDGEQRNFTDQVSMKVKPNALKFFVPNDFYTSTI